MFIVLVSLSSIMGCGNSDSLKKFELSGQVTLDGAPVPVGEISFTPDFSEGNSGPGSIAKIVHGKYQTQSGKGLVGGPYLVQITAYDGVAVMESWDGSSLLKSQYEEKVIFPDKPDTRDFDIPASYKKVR
ncbi:MAG TPA: hypothetical protein VNQ76_17080 [Planctomicrobium sp.]|nr:hypothetical protein [Planctomicrobium sp.]